MKTVILSLFTLSLLVLSACTPDKPPSQIYEEYNSKVIQGIAFADEKAYFTKRKQEEVEAKMPQYMESMSKTRIEVIKIYLDFSRGLAKCKEIALVKEEITGNTATLEYSQKDICENESTSQEKQSIRMINENGWKIDDVVVSI
jgi:hypothetical protein